jgi:tagatose-6-phosphate ketose/aldose isomerase
MCFIGERTLVVCFLSSDPLVRRYEADLIAELNAKQLGARKLLAGAGDPADDMAGPRDLPISYPFANPAPHDLLALLDVMLAQLLGFHRSRIEGLPPDSPSVDGVISRVVNKFEIHRPGDADEDSDRR